MHAPLGNLSVNHTAMTPSEASRIARDVWALDLTAVRLHTEKDDTFRVTTPNGQRYVLKVSHPAEDASEIDQECRAMEHVAECGVPVPRHVPDLSGRLATRVQDDAGQSRIARLLTFIEGTPLDMTDASTRERECIGETLAALRHALADFRSPSNGRWCAWDVTNLPDLRSLLDKVAAGEHEMLLRAAFERYMTETAPRVSDLRRQLLHNDFNRSNIIVDHDAPAFVTGIVDFGDMVHTAIAIDVATALLNQLPRDAAHRGREDIFNEGRDVLRGYLRYADLTAEELALLPQLVMGRIVARALISLYRAELMPENRTYVLRNTEQGWGQLAWFMARNTAEISRSFLL